MKESEALTKLCFRKFNMNDKHFDDYVVVMINCEGSKCMAWEPEYNKEYKTFNEGEIIPDDWIKTNKFIAHEYHRYIKTDSGDCGLLSKECNCQC